MARYTVHVPAGSADRAQALEQSEFVRDGWSWGAFVFGPLWLLWHRHWLVGIGALIVSGLIYGAIGYAPVLDQARSAASLLISLLWGLEGASLRRLALARRGFNEEGVAVGTDRDALEQRYFAADEAQAGSLEAGGDAPGRRPAPAFAPSPGFGVIGLFPEARNRS